jgi:uncharacterized protein (DUF169 family)
MDTKQIKQRLKDGLGIHKEIIALRQVKVEPQEFDAYQDKNNICYMMGEVLEEGRTFYTILDDHVCLLGCAATGLDPELVTMDTQEHRESENFHVSAINIFPTERIQAKAEKEAARLFPRFKEVNKAIIIGPLERVPEPEVAVIIATPEQVHLMTRAYCYATGSFIQGYAGMGACRMLFPHAFLKQEPTFTVSDRSWRKALHIAPDELTLVTPIEKLIIMIETLEASKKEGFN